MLAQYLSEVVQQGLDNVVDNGGDISAQIALTNKIVSLIQNITKEADFASMGVAQRAEQLLALLRENDPRLILGKTANDVERPETSVAQSSLFAGAIHEPQMFSELKKEIGSSNQIDMLVSFIKWSDLRLIMDELRDFTQNGGQLRIITTSYMGATDIKAIEELSKLPNTEIKVSYDTKRTRLHAKTYVFYRDTGFTTAYVGSSNLSNAAISSGLEWNVKVTAKDLPSTIQKIATLSDELKSFIQSGNYEPYILELMNRSKVIFLGQYAKNEDQSNNQCDFYDVQTCEKYEAKLPFDKKEGNLMCSDQGSFKKWLEFMMDEEAEFGEKIVLKRGKYSVDSLRLYKTMEKRLKTVQEDENAVILFPYPISLDLEGDDGLNLLHFCGDILSSIFGKLKDNGVVGSRKVYVIYPSADGKMVLRCLNTNRREYLMAEDLSKVFAYSFSLL